MSIVMINNLVDFVAIPSVGDSGLALLIILSKATWSQIVVVISPDDCFVSFIIQIVTQAISTQNNHRD